VFLADLRANLIRGDAALEQRLGLEEWVNGTGIPANAVHVESDAFARVEAQAQRFLSGTPAAQLATAQWSTQEWQHFLGALPRGLTPAQLGDLDRAFRLSEQGNSEILFAWLQMAVRHRYEPAMPALERFLTSQGRRKFVRPLFVSLMEQGEWGQALARRIYAQARPGYHPVTANSVDEIVRM
jgi:leukotriene-A4 hydrolase